MAYFLAALALLAFGGLGWYTARHRTTTTTIAAGALLLTAAVAILVVRGPAQQVIAGGLVGLMVGSFTGEFTRRNLASPTPGERTS